MDELQFSPGDLIFREGDESYEAYYVATGSVEIRIEGTGDLPPRTLSHIGQGEIFGEMAMVTDHPRSATAVARGPEVTRLVRFDEPFFRDRILGDPEQVRSFIGTLIDRLRDTDALLRAELARHAKQGGRVDHARAAAALEGLFGTAENSSGSGTSAPEELPAPGAQPPQVRLRSTYAPGSSFRPFENEIRRFPFRIGRSFGEEGSVAFSQADLILDDVRPFQISRVHCDFLLDAHHRVLVRDRGSRLGTIVNGTAIGTAFDDFAAALKPGENEILLGSEDSPHRILATVS